MLVYQRVVEIHSSTFYGDYYNGQQWISDMHTFWAKHWA